MSDLLPRLGQLVRLLGSPIDNEALAASRGLTRVLGSAGHDLHWLAERIENGIEPRVIYRDALGHKTPPPAEAPPLWEDLRRLARLSWLEHASASSVLDGPEREVCAVSRAQIYSQPHVILKAAVRATINVAIAKLWHSGVRV